MSRWDNDVPWCCGAWRRMWQATALTTVLHQLKSNATLSFVTNAMYLTLTDLPGQPDSAHGYGLCNQDTATGAITPRPSYTALKDFDKQWP